MFDYKLALAVGGDIPIPELQLTIHQPTIKEISLIGETDFFTGIQLLCIDKKMYIEDETLLAQTNNFQIFMTMINQPEMADKKEAVLSTLTLLLPQSSVIFTPRSMMLRTGDMNIMVDEGNFETLQTILREIFCLNKTDQSSFNPQSTKAKEIARKLMKARQRVAELNAKENSGSMFGRYLSVLTVGLGSMTLQECCQLTMYQIYDLLERYTLYINWDIDIKSRMAGAKGDKPVEDWMKNIHQN